jgi:NADPH:quinone reductase-like Zn-dependent oxidoreductase
MKALVFSESGQASEVLRYVEHPEPIAENGEALVEVLSRPIQPADLAFISGKYRVQPQFPQAAGLEGVGRILAAPHGSGLSEGQRVAFRWPGTWAERAAVPFERLLVVPDVVPDDTAAQMALNPLTAWGLLASQNASPGEAILVTAGTSTVSQIVAGLCKPRDIRVIAVVRGDAQGAHERSSADAIVSSESPTLLDDIKQAAAGLTVTGLLDCVGGPLVNRLIPALSPGATMVAYGVMDQQPALIPNAALIYTNLTWIGFGIDRWLGGLTPAARTEVVDQLWGAVARGDFLLPAVSRHPLAEFVVALSESAEQGRTGKVMLI